MQQELTDVVLDIRGNRDLLTTDEASIKAGVVLRLLRVLGWDPFNIREITPEYAIGGRRVDSALRVLGANKVFASRGVRSSKIAMRVDNRITVASARVRRICCRHRSPSALDRRIGFRSTLQLLFLEPSPIFLPGRKSPRFFYTHLDSSNR